MGCPTLFFDTGCSAAFHAPLYYKLQKLFMKERYCTKKKSFNHIKVLFWHRQNHQDKERIYTLGTLAGLSHQAQALSTFLSLPVSHFSIFNA
ncbi:hypothetical protein NC652_040990 [Populus alba x Populus x berolinensis]|uniref:Uncharacterized protein n=1 Tax=Populus alba x Populus x berolinensis TaxID=444605 RepID=A0AAD6W980_9ROSI|nr:hypothetical protein NC652_040990 [Populus alba x Populus x berolinensis]KAJ6951934.1 hypothetical protein NC653_041181 [Populus alba x Populus x berolinensis]KAJ7002394.1 hypothetical protein NC653_007760 [Populus alba x Populus x berolinensis]